MMDNNKKPLKEHAARLLCLIGFHDFQVMEVSFTFGDSGNIEKLQCKRCKLVVSQQTK
jgi:hypothetical protein